MGEDAGQVYDLAVGYAQQVVHRLRHDQPRSGEGAAANLRGPFSVAGPDYAHQFLNVATGWKDKVPLGALEANDSPAAYPVHLYGVALSEEKASVGDKTVVGQMSILKERRPDLGSLSIDDATMNEVIPQVRLVNEILGKAIQNEKNLHDLQAVNALLAVTRYPNTLPYHHGHEQIQAAQSVLETTLQEIALPQIIGLPRRILAPRDTLEPETAKAFERLQIMASQLAPDQQAIVIEPAAQSAEFFGKAYNDTALTAEKFKDMEVLTARTGLTAQQVERLLCTTAGGSLVIRSPNVPDPPAADAAPTGTAAPTLYGARFVNAAEPPEMAVERAADGALTVKNLSDDRLDRINRMVRLQRWLDLPYDEVDLLVTAAMAAEGQANATLQMNDNTLRTIGVFRLFKTRRGVTAPVFAAWLHQVSPFAVSPQIPFFDQVFNTRGAFDTPLVLDASSFVYALTTGADGTIVKQISTALGLSHRQFLRLAEAIAREQGSLSLCTLPCSLDVLSAFHRIVSLARALGFTLDDLCTLLDRLGHEAGVTKGAGPSIWTQVAGRPVLARLGADDALAKDILGVLQALDCLANWIQDGTLPPIGSWGLLLSETPARATVRPDGNFGATSHAGFLRHLAVGWKNAVYDPGNGAFTVVHQISFQSEAPVSSFEYRIPRIVSRYDSKGGLIQYLDFRSERMPTPTRLNTTFVRTLIERANLGLDSLLTYALQDEPLEANLTADGAGEIMDFDGANGMYFWELFFHLPFLVADRFAAEQQFAPARTWLHYIFDPSRKGTPPAPDYWNVRPLMAEEGDLSGQLADPFDPDARAYAHPTIYRKAVFIAYVATLIAEGDAWYRRLTRDGLTQARILYGMAAELLGPRPDVSVISAWTPQTLDSLAGASSDTLRAFERELDASTLPALPGRNASYLQVADNKRFGRPLDVLMLDHWATLAARLYNLRHSLTLDGKPMVLPLYEPPADPTALLAQRARSGVMADGAGGLLTAVPPYRFTAMLARAYAAVGTLSRFGDTLLSLLERGERAGQEELAQQHLMDMSSYTLTLQQQAIDGVVADRAALVANRDVARQRHDHYYALFQENISAAEQKVMDKTTAAQALLDLSQDFDIVSGTLKELPNIFGVADGGSRYEGVTQAVAGGMVMAGQVLNIEAARLGTAESYRRRRQDWQIQYQQAEAEIAALDRQIDALAIRETSARTAFQQAAAQQAQTQAMLTFLKSRFSQATLYQWLSGEMGALYYQAYDAVVSLCLGAQACWQYEVGDIRTGFIKTGAWNDHYRGLHIGETLLLNLHQMEAAYLARNERRLNVVRTVSLKSIMTDADDFNTSKKTGSFTFHLTEDMFDRDYAGHYLRQIKTLSVTLPTLVGPYQDVKAILTQTSSSTLLAPDPDGVRYLRNTKTGSGRNVVTNLRPRQQVALSSGMNDTGSFELRLDDERYLSFEGTGAVSDWTLVFPSVQDEDPLKADPQQKALLDNLDDVLVQVRYTACDGGADFAAEVKKTLT